MSSAADDFTQKLLDRTRARNEALQQKMQEHLFQGRKRRPLETQENIDTAAIVHSTLKTNDNIENSENESPSKRTRMDPGVIDGDSMKPEAVETKAVGEKSVSERMQKLLNQRKQWEAADQGEEIDFSDIPSPVRNDQKSPVVGGTLNRKIDIERKARLAAFAKEISSREDDLNHPIIPKQTPEKSTIQSKPPSGTGRTTPMSKTYQAQIGSSAQTTDAVKSTSSDGIRTTKNVSQRVSLSIETLNQFANKDRKPIASNPNSTPVKSNIKTKLAAERISVSSCSKDTDEVVGHQVTPTTKSLQQRLIELQKHGCKAEQNAGTGKALVDRRDELNRLRKDSLADDENHQDDAKVADDEEDSCMAVTTPFTPDEENSSVFEHDASATSLGKSDAPELYTDAEESGLSFGDSMMDSFNDTNVNDETGTSEEEIIQAAEGSTMSEDIHPLEEDSEDQQMIDDLFEGVENEEEDDDDLKEPVLYSEMSILGVPSLTRQKSRQEIRSELTACKQTYHEAEDRHVINRNASRRLRPLARSNSTESLGAEKPLAEPPASVFTIDEYRSEKRKSLRSVQKKIVRKEEVEQVKEDFKCKSRITSLKEKNAKLLDEVQQQQRVIQQASAALNCCYDAQHGKGSITELEAEKLLLIASERRLALLAEVQKLKAPSLEGSSLCSIQPCRGRVTLDRIQLPLRTEYIFSIASKKDGGDSQSHYYFILVRCGPHKIVATHLASTHDSLSGDALLFKDKFQFDELESDFEICAEVYSVNHRARADGVPNQEKSKRKISGLLQKSLTPRKLKSRSSHQAMSHHASPGGPNAIRISSFTLIGSTMFRLSDAKKTKFVLQKVPFMSPISGHLACKINIGFQSGVEQRGFLTMFDDVGGLGAWHRRWCALMRGVLYSWTYPDDEKHKEALSKVEIRECISKDVRTVERIMCARPNTFELRTMRPRRQGDKDNLISQDTGSVVTTKHWLAADTKEERQAWIAALNQALADTRAWDTAALKPLA